MKRLAPFVMAAALFGLTCAGLYIVHMKRMEEVYEKRESLIYENTDVRNSCRTALEWVLEKNSILVFGSSELSSSDNVAYPPYLFKEGSSDFNMVLMGRGYMQSLHHAITLGGIADRIPDKKVVLILSPQWFTSWHLDSQTYASRFSERMYSEFLKNPQLPREIKEKVTDRLETLLKEDSVQLERIGMYRRAYVEERANFIERAGIDVYDSFMNFRQEYLLEKHIRERDSESEEDMVKAEEIDFELLMEKAQMAGEAVCTNNNYYIYDEYYDTYIRDVEQERRGSLSESSYQVSPEYDDLRIFLNVCKATGVEPLIVSVPVNGRWYDWTGFPKEDREAYYDNIRKICEEYQVELADFSDKEYEKYFLKDVMHMGWKGWVYLDEAVYRFWREEGMGETSGDGD